MKIMEPKKYYNQQ